MPLMGVTRVHFLLSHVVTDSLRDLVSEVVFTLLFLGRVCTVGMVHLSQDLPLCPPPKRPSHRRHRKPARWKQRQRGAPDAGSAESVWAGRRGRAPGKVQRGKQEGFLTQAPVRSRQLGRAVYPNAGSLPSSPSLTRMQTPFSAHGPGLRRWAECGLFPKQS